MKSKKIYIIIFSLIAAIVLFELVKSAFMTRNININANDETRQEQRVVVSNLILTETKDANKYWELYASKGNYESGEQRVQLEDILGNFYDENQEVVLSLQAASGTYDQETKLIKLNGNVLAVSKDGSSILSDEMLWKGKEEDIIANGNVKINKDNQLVTTSDKAIFNSDFTYFKIEGKSESRVYEKVEGE